MPCAAQIRRGIAVLNWGYAGRAETRRRYALARPLFCVVSCLEMGRDVGFAESGFRPTARFQGAVWVGLLGL